MKITTVSLNKKTSEKEEVNINLDLMKTIFNDKRLKETDLIVFAGGSLRLEGKKKFIEFIDRECIYTPIIIEFGIGLGSNLNDDQGYCFFDGSDFSEPVKELFTQGIDKEEQQFASQEKVTDLMTEFQRQKRIFKVNGKNIGLLIDGEIFLCENGKQRYEKITKDFIKKFNISTMLNLGHSPKRRIEEIKENTKFLSKDDKNVVFVRNFTKMNNDEHTSFIVKNGEIEYSEKDTNEKYRVYNYEL